MSKGGDRIQVFRTTRVRTVFKNDGSWIHKPKEDKEEEKDVRPDPSADGKLAVTKRKSYVLQTAKKFGVIDSSVIPHSQTAVVTTSEGPQASTVEEIHNGRAQHEIPVSDKMQENGGTQLVLLDVELSEGATDIPVEECGQAVSAAGGEAVELPLEKPAEQPLNIQNAVNKVEYVESSATPSVPDNSEISDVDGSCAKGLIEDAKAVDDADIREKSLSVVTLVIHAAEEVVQVSDSVPDIVDSVTKARSQPANETITNESEPSPTEPITEEILEDASEVVIESTLDGTNVTPKEEDASEIVIESTINETNVTPKEEDASEVVIASTLDGTNVTQKEEDASDDATKTVPDVVSEISGLVPTLVCDVDSAPQKELKTTTEEHDEMVAELSEPKEEPALMTTKEDVGGKPEFSTFQDGSVLIPTNGKCELLSAPQEMLLFKTPSEEVVNGESKLSVSVEATKEEETENEGQSEPEDHLIKIISVVEPEPISQVETDLKSTKEEADVYEEQPHGDITEDQSTEPAPKIPEDRGDEQNVDDSSEPAIVYEAGTVQSYEVHQFIELTDALDVEPPPIKFGPEPGEDPETLRTEPIKQDKQHETKPDLKGLCSFCNEKMDGLIRITLSDPPVTCHPDCLKCGVCARVLGDFLSPMFLQGQVIRCGRCVAGALRI